MLGSWESPWLVFTRMPVGKGEWELLLMGWVEPNLDMLWAFVSMGFCAWPQAKGKDHMPLGTGTHKIFTWLNWAGQPLESRCKESLGRIGWGIQQDTLRAKIDHQDSCWICPSGLCPIGEALRSTARGAFPRRVRTNPKPRSYIVFFPPDTGPGHLAWSRHSWEGDLELLSGSNDMLAFLWIRRSEMRYKSTLYPVWCHLPFGFAVVWFIFANSSPSERTQSLLLGPSYSSTPDMMGNTLQLAEMVQAFAPTTELGNSYQPISTCNHLPLGHLSIPCQINYCISDIGASTKIKRKNRFRS